MKTSEKIMAKTENLKKISNMLGKAGYGMKLAAGLGYKFGYNMAKHPNIEKVKKQIEHHPRSLLITLAGILIGIFGVTGFVLKRQH